MINIREQLAHDLLGCEYSGLNAQKKSVIDLIADQRPTGVDGTLRNSTWAERLADSVARIGGSWPFIIGFSSALALWIVSNLLLAASGVAFDPYPFIFLNPILSMVAALQAPLIMMSQNRQSAKDRAAAEHDYVVNLRAELEIMLLHDKLDALRDQDTMGRVDVLSQKIEELTKAVASRA